MNRIVNIDGEDKMKRITKIDEDELIVEPLKKQSF